MMGQQQQMVAEKEAGGALLRRIVLALTVAAVVALMTALAAGPAQAKNCDWFGEVHQCVKENTTPSGNDHVRFHEHEIKDGPAEGGGAEVRKDDGFQTVDTPAGNRTVKDHGKLPK